MTRISAKFDQLRREGRKGFIAYLTCGDPHVEATVEEVLLLERAGVDIIELGMPFSDPLADGKVNQAAADRALRSGTTVSRFLDTVKTIRRSSGIPIVLFSYLNPLIAHDFRRLCRKAARSGLDGMLILDLPVEESRMFSQDLKRAGLDHIFLVAPTSPDERIRKIARASSGFVYCISLEGVTGMRDELGGDARRLVERTRRFTSLPIALGFGIATPRQAARVAEYADAVVVGSAIVDRFFREGDSRAGRQRAAAWVRELVRAVKGVEA
ncbi:MAG TPA: tryptophan synthase subunit alpha [Kiritimatiellae bacterium]|nr:tryptophan synthase subunit alpha [Kiritimatiellia bacterium]